MPIVTLLTDYGLRDPYIGEVKGALLARAPQAALVDLTHAVMPGDLRAASWLVGRAWDRFPEGTVHLVVVDPGVGTDRRALIAAGAGRFFVGPDNGLLSHASERFPDGWEYREISRPPEVSPGRGTTFDGRDVFAVAAGRLAAGEAFDALGEAASDPVRLRSFTPIGTGRVWDTEIHWVDGYGNLVTGAEEGFLRSAFGDAWRDIVVRVGNREIRGIRNAYAEVGRGEPVLTIGGGGTLEIAVNGGRAVRVLGPPSNRRVRIVAGGDG
ncbi:MAG: SAM-dependent chlorinase/fluorinase [Gemmatimonadota bacterium]|jgi:hypothetical protein|nr:hypothetical protein [Gemmatimonadota bacterium]MDP6460802.1 SAM-dependent chlorinase/fluorinase [Gemmatimonadota bacterium]MDP6529922.1 SAM-dependent chlorinase/fluorinase [Gemmatimonadota bacterium]MDP6802159.1 SAM-dependent chlorinase/fluorinase [Gemmatimonadota bacterium]MDP7032798.1 SAM-dependent chlorinase/fluorinase [Gemmatimonadota bacterium]